MIGYNNEGYMQHFEFKYLNRQSFSKTNILSEALVKKRFLGVQLDTAVLELDEQNKVSKFHMVQENRHFRETLIHLRHLRYLMWQ